MVRVRARVREWVGFTQAEPPELCHLLARTVELLRGVATSDAQGGSL